jgi:hypothetical protein
VVSDCVTAPGEEADLTRTTFARQDRTSLKITVAASGA